MIYLLLKFTILSIHLKFGCNYSALQIILIQRIQPEYLSCIASKCQIHYTLADPSRLSLQAAN